MPNNLYIGSRYVPIFDGAWDNTKSYEALTIVEYGNNSYTSKRPVPVGTLPTNTSYWALTGNYNGAISNLQNQIGALTDLDTTDKDNLVDAINENVSKIQTLTNRLDDVNYNFIRNKRILICGDSISDESVQNPNWVTRLRTINTNLGLNATITNISEAGNGWCSPNPNSDGLIDDLNANTGDYDIIILWAGINDRGAQFPIGTPSDSNRTTVFGALYQIHDVCHAKWPKALVYWLSAPHCVIGTQDEKPIPLNVYRSVAHMACARYNWLEVDTANIPLYNIKDYPTDLTDGIHPKPYISQILCDYIIGKLASYGGEPLTNVSTYHLSSFDGGVSGNIWIDFTNKNTAKLRMYLTGTWSAGQQINIKTDYNGYKKPTALNVPTSKGIMTVYFFANQLEIKFPGANSTDWVDFDFVPVSYYEVEGRY